MGNKYGWKQTDIALSSLVEIIFTLFAALVISIVCSYNNFMNLLHRFVNMQRVVIIVSIMILIILCITCSYFKLKKATYYIKRLFTREFLILSFKIVIMNFIGFFLCGLSFVLVYKFILGVNIYNMFNVISIYILSWVIGFIVPGSPGGIGIREAILTLMLSEPYGYENTIVAALVYRVICILGDALVYAAGVMLQKNTEIQG